MANDLDRWMPAPVDFGEAVKMAEWLCKSSMVPDAYRGRPADLLIVADFGRRLGLPLFTALQTIAIINGKATAWGDGMLALCQRHPSWGGMVVEVRGADKGMVATATVKRAGVPDTVRSFAVADAMRAGLLEKRGTWQTYPQRMLAMRARSWALRDAFADALMGLGSAEEVIQIDGDVPMDRVLDMPLPEQVPEPEDPAGDIDDVEGAGEPPPRRACVDCGEPVTSTHARAMRCERHISTPPVSRRRGRPPGRRSEAAEDRPQPREPLPGQLPMPEPELDTLAERMATAPDVPTLMALGREAAAATGPLLEQLRRSYADRQRELVQAALASQQHGGDAEGMEALRERARARGR